MGACTRESESRNQQNWKRKCPCFVLRCRLPVANLPLRNVGWATVVLKNMFSFKWSDFMENKKTICENVLIRYDSTQATSTTLAVPTPWRKHFQAISNWSVDGWQILKYRHQHALIYETLKRKLEIQMINLSFRFVLWRAFWWSYKSLDYFSQSNSDKFFWCCEITIILNLVFIGPTKCKIVSLSYEDSTINFEINVTYVFGLYWKLRNLSKKNFFL